MTAPTRIRRARKPKVLPLVTQAERDELSVFDPDPLCDRCDASFRAPGDTLCAACRHEVDEFYHDLPGASTAP